MISRDLVTQAIYEIIGQDLIDRAETVDDQPNHLQIKGSPEVKVIALGVSTSLDFLKKAVNANANYLITHHGLSELDIVKGRFNAIENRLKFIIDNNLTLASFHYALDAHPEIGNNAQIIKKLVAVLTNEPYFNKWGWIGEFKIPLHIDDLIFRLEHITNHPAYVIKTGNKKIKRIGVCSGGAKPHGNELMEIIDKKIDAHITGEIGESSPYIADEIGFNYLSCGHNATETFGVQALSEKLIDRFGIDVQIKFININNPL